MKYKVMQIVPDRYLNNDNILGLVDSFHALYATPLQRTKFNIKSKDACLVIKDKNRIWWEIFITKDNIQFFIISPEEWHGYIKNQVESCWSKAEIRDISDNNLKFDDKYTECATMHLGQHYFLSLKTDKRIVAPLPQIFEVAKTMGDGDKALIQIGFEPTENDWYEGCQMAYERFKNGEFPRRFEVTPSRLIKGTAKILATIGLGIMSTGVELITDQEVETMPLDDVDRGQMIRHGGLSSSTLAKAKHDAFDITIRLVSQARDKRRRELTLRGLSAALRSLNEDNELVLKPTKNHEKLLKQVTERSFPFFKVNKDYLSDAEVAKLVQLPSWNLQQEYPVENLDSRELPVPEYLTKDGILIGTIKYRGIPSKVYMPVNNYDELCLLEIVIGGLGSGKSLGKGAGKAVDAIRKGFSCFVIDVTDGDMANTVRDSLPIWFPDDHLIDLDFGNRQYAFPLNWNESATQLDNLDFADELSNQLTSYLEKFADEVGDRTNRYIKAAGKVVFANPHNTLLEVILMLCSKEYRKKALENVTDPRLLDMWRDFDTMSEGMKQTIVSPILNRIDRLTGSRYLSNCIFQRPKSGKEKLDFRKFADGDKYPYCVILRCPKSILKKNCDPLVTFLIAKIWLSVLTRIDLVISARKPCFLIMDEPHQFLGSAKGGIESTWGEMIAESRKWRLGQTFMFHDMGQIPNELMKLMKSAMPHYSIYSSSKETYKALQEEISPFTLEEAMEMPTHHAINIIRSHGEYHKFRALMAAPPIDVKAIPYKSWRYGYIDRSHRTKECLEQFGRLREVVEDDIYKREKILYQETIKTRK